jgi:methylated-DNA-[protein]-cysteine S-methyltransferase
MLVFETELGECGIEWSDAGVTRVLLPGRQPLGGPRSAEARDVPEGIRQAVAGIVALLRGEARDLREVVLDESGVDSFRQAVFAATRAIGPGETASYGEIAQTVGQPDAARAVGAALGSNPWPVIVPCHRIVSATGALTGFSAPGGVETKRRMLEIEQALGFRQQALSV